MARLAVRLRCREILQSPRGIKLKLDNFWFH